MQILQAARHSADTAKTILWYDFFKDEPQDDILDKWRLINPLLKTQFAIFYRTAIITIARI